MSIWTMPNEWDTRSPRIFWKNLIVPDFSILFSCLLLLGSCFPVWGQASEQVWDIQLVVPISTPKGERVVSLDRYERIHVSLTNQSDVSQKIWKDWNTWGFFNLTLYWANAHQQVIIRRKTPSVWNGDFPDFWEIPPKESIILEVDLSTGEWEGFPDLYGESISASMYAVYENKPDQLANEFGIWTGKIQTAPISVIFK